MGDKTPIEWCDTTVNPTMGCDGCELWQPDNRKCYAGVRHKRFGKGNSGYANDFEVIEKFPGRMQHAAKYSDLRGRRRAEKPWLNELPRLLFVSDMSDALSADIEFEYLKGEIIDTVVSDPGLRHRWLWLTKRPARMAEFDCWLMDRGVTWPANLWPGTSITSKATTSRINPLFDVGNEATTRFLSVEPQIEAIDLTKWLPRLSWIIQGGESGHGARPFDIAWAASLQAVCQRHNVPYFLKQLGAHVVDGRERVVFDDGHGGNWDEWPVDLRVREMPNGE